MRGSLWPRLSCRCFAANAVRLRLLQLRQLHAHAWSLTSLRKKPIKISAKVISHHRYVTFQMADVPMSRQMFQHILLLIARLRAPPALA